MSNAPTVNWPDVAAWFGSLAVMAMILLLIACAQLWRQHIHRTRREVRGRADITKDASLEAIRQERVLEYMRNADFTNEGNPHIGWKDRFLERSFIEWSP